MPRETRVPGKTRIVAILIACAVANTACNNANRGSGSGPDATQQIRIHGGALKQISIPEVMISIRILRCVPPEKRGIWFRRGLARNDR